MATVGGLAGQVADAAGGPRSPEKVQENRQVQEPQAAPAVQEAPSDGVGDAVVINIDQDRVAAARAEDASATEASEPVSTDTSIEASAAEATEEPAAVTEA